MSEVAKQKPKWHKIAGWNRVEINLVKLKKDYLNSKPVTAIAKEYNVSIQTIYSRLKKLGITKTNSESHFGISPWNKGKRKPGATSYVNVYKNGKYIREHRIVAEKILGRLLKQGEVVHHKNGNRRDNRPENLEVHSSHSEHMRLHMSSSEARKRGSKGGWAKRKAALKAVGVSEDEIRKASE